MLGDHLGLKEALDKGFISKDVKRAIVHGNPDRVSEQAKLLKGAKLVAKKRGFITYVGEYNSAKIMISSTGMGSASASIAIEELIEFGIEKIIRVGTCGGYLNEIKPGDLVVPTATLIETPVLRYLYPNYMHEKMLDMPKWMFLKDGFIFVEGFKEVYDKIIENLEIELKNQAGHHYFVGPVHDKDILHAWRPEYNRMPNELILLKNKIKQLTIATDMETGSLYTISHLRGVKSGSLLVVVDFFADQKTIGIQNNALNIAYNVSLKAITKT
jgi:uridine phosphorylase